MKGLKGWWKIRDRAREVKENALQSYLTQIEVASMFGVTTRTVRNWISQGLITAYKRNGYVVLIDERSLDNVLSPIKAKR